MSEIYFDQDIISIRDSVQRFRDKYVSPLVEECDADERFPIELVDPLLESGILRMPLPPEYGGIDASCQTLSVVIEEISFAMPALGSVLLSCFSPMRIVSSIAKPHQAQAFHRLIASKPMVLAFCLSEPSVGSDARAMRTRADKKAGAWVLNGRKRWISSATVAGCYLVFARTGQGPSDFSCFAVPADSMGLSFGKPEKKMGFRAQVLADVVFDNVEVPEEYLIGEPGEGWRALTNVANTMRCWGAAAIATGLARAALEVAARYANEREAFGRKIGKFQGISFKLADMAIAVRQSELLLRDTNWRVDRELPDVSEKTQAQVSMAKCHAADAAMRITTEAVQILGGYGYMREYHVERMMRDAKAIQIFDGSNEIQRLIIGKHLLKLS
jgi:alkylation response protein AidB-like acyl-CoA dehydrogenase